MISFVVCIYTKFGRQKTLGEKCKLDPNAEDRTRLEAGGRVITKAQHLPDSLSAPCSPCGLHLLVGTPSAPFVLINIFAVEPTETSLSEGDVQVQWAGKSLLLSFFQVTTKIPFLPGSTLALD